MKCPQDDVEIVVFGQRSLVCLKCSRVPRIGFDSPKKWRDYTLGAVILGALLFALSFVLSPNVLAYLRSFGSLFIVDGVFFSY